MLRKKKMDLSELHLKASFGLHFSDIGDSCVNFFPTPVYCFGYNPNPARSQDKVPNFMGSRLRSLVTEILHMQILRLLGM